MSGVDVLNARPLALRAHSDVLTTQRLDLDYYLPERVAAEARVCDGRHRTATLNSLRRKDRPITDGIRRHDKSESGVHLIRTQNLNGPSVDYASTAFINEEWHRTSLKSEVQPGDLLVAIRGYLGAAAIVVDGSPRANINQHIARIGVDETKCSTRYLWAFLSSSIGRTILERYVTGTVQRGVTLPDLRALRVPLPDRRIQQYIGAKVELAERCRSHSVKLRNQALELLTESWAWGDRGPAELQDKAASQIAHAVEPRIFDDRLDPEFYRPSFLAVERWLDGQACWRLSELVEAPVKGVQPSYDPDGTIPALTVTHVDPFVLDRDGASGLVTDAWLSRNARARINAGELLYTVTGPPLGETVVVEEFHLPAAVNSHVARVALRPHFKFPHLVAGMLNSPLGQLQTTRYSKGIRQKELYPVDFVRFRFPKLSSQTCVRLERDLAASCRLVEQARVLVEEAKADVEALIEGALDVQAILAGTLKAPTADDIPELAEDGA